MTWDASPRRQSLPTDWNQRVAAVKQRDRVCQWPTDHGICGMPGRDVDHRLGRDNHDLDALWLLCAPHHNAKTQREAAAARPRQQRPAERHPGLA